MDSDEEDCDEELRLGKDMRVTRFGVMGMGLSEKVEISELKSVGILG